MREETVLLPSQVAQYLKGMMERDRLLSGLMVRGELSNYKIHYSGHHYFTLKDRDGALDCVMYRSDASALRFRPQNGMQVLAAGRVSVYPQTGRYQLYCRRLTPDGVGDLYLAFEQMKERLLREGLFDQGHKKPIPRFPGVIALVTSPVGAAVRDMIRILGARWPMARVRVLPVRVQGEGAAEEIAAAIRWCSWKRAADLIITGRGGGSMEDLWAFNEEVVARAIYDSAIPVISAVGHEPDVTIADFAADLRASTPSNAAELAVPDQNEIAAALLEKQDRLGVGMGRRLSQYRRNLTRLAGSRAMTEPASYFQYKRMALDRQYQRLTGGLERNLSQRKERLARLAASLDALSPLKVLGRGYAIAQKEDGTLIASVRDGSPGERFCLRLSDGGLNCEIESISTMEGDE